MLRAKRAVEAVIESGEIAVRLANVESIDSLASELRKFGMDTSLIDESPVDVCAVRAGLGMTQEQFALRFNIELAALRNWEQGRYSPDKIAQSYFRAIQRAPKTVSATQERRVAAEAGISEEKEPLSRSKDKEASYADRFDSTRYLGARGVERFTIAHSPQHLSHVRAAVALLSLAMDQKGQRHLLRTERLPEYGDTEHRFQGSSKLRFLGGPTRSLTEIEERCA